MNVSSRPRNQIKCPPSHASVCSNANNDAARMDGTGQCAPPDELVEPLGHQGDDRPAQPLKGRTEPAKPAAKPAITFRLSVGAGEGNRTLVISLEGTLRVLPRAGDLVLRIRRLDIEGADLVRARPGSAAVRLRRDLVPVARHARDQEEPGGGRAHPLRLPDDRRQRDGEAGARQGDAGDPDDTGRDGSMADRTGRRGARTPAPAARRCPSTSSCAARRRTPSRR